MGKVGEMLDTFPVVSFIFVVVVLVGAIKAVAGDLDYGEFVEYVKALGIGAGAMGGARAIATLGRK